MAKPKIDRPGQIDRPQMSTSDSVIQAIARIVTSTLDINDVYEQFARKVGELLDFDQIYINVFDLETETFYLHYIYDTFRTDSEPVHRHSSKGRLVQWVMNSGLPLIRQDLAEDLRFVDDARNLELGLRSSLTVPLISKGVPIGTFGLGSRRVGAFGLDEQAILEKLGNLIAPSVDHASVYQRLRAGTQEMALVDEVAQIITSTLDIDQVYEKFAQEMKKLVDFDRISVQAINHEEGMYTLKYLVGQERPGRPVGSPRPLAGSQSEEVVLSGKSLVREDASRAPRFPSDEAQAKLGMHASIAVPLISKGLVNGVLVLRSLRVGAYGNREQVILERLAKQIAPAVENAEMYQRLQESSQEMALVDEVARIITSTLDIDQACGEFTREMKKLVDFERALISVVDREAATFTLQYIFGVPRVGQAIGSVTPLQDTVTGELAKTGRTIIWGDISAKPGFADDQAHVELGLLSCIGLPLFSKGMVIGSLLLRSRQVNAYGARDQAILERLAGQIAPAIENAQLYDRVRSEKELATNTLAQLKAVLGGVDSGILLVDNDRHTLWANQKYGELFGIRAVESLSISHPTQEERHDLVRHTFADPEEVFEEELGIYRDPSFTGSTKEVVLFAPVKRILQPFTTPVYDEENSPLGRMWVYHDVTGVKTAEEQILQFQKMESIGRLAGGIAHDFNNLLTAIMGYAQLAMLEAPSNGYLGNHVQEIQKAAERAANLTNQLLAFSRRQVIEPKVINLNDSIIDLSRMLRRLIGKDIELITRLGHGISSVKVDPTKLEQVLVNLVVNCRDAMPSGGKLTIETAMADFDSPVAEQFDGPSLGKYVVLSVTDTGMGMSEAVKAHLFEPFFTTKAVGKGTGLGLAICYGIIKQSGGHIDVSSEFGQGSCVSVYLPSSTEIAAYPAVEEVPHRDTFGNETVLVAEDDMLVRGMVTDVLKGQGYTVLQAADGDEALRLAQELCDQRIDLLLTDLVMPQMGGLELANRLSALRPETKIIFTSGYTDEPFFTEGINNGKVEFIQKPFVPSVLTARVRDLLDRDL
ncbi:MAG: GAF domain-containing protein [Chloroflexi bacterium]|nr:GAF domain-containing protein [Chloroflexota bacterium]